MPWFHYVTLHNNCKIAYSVSLCCLQVIHPSQVPVVQDAFSPSQQMVDWAGGVIVAFQQHQESGKVCLHWFEGEGKLTFGIRKQ